MEKYIICVFFFLIVFLCEFS
uniref:Uncharacterized protein n=1 Tax=Anguilla anguilla TaxID=7936 RepID=A0A0E9R5T7_ANGAN